MEGGRKFKLKFMEKDMTLKRSLSPVQSFGEVEQTAAHDISP